MELKNVNTRRAVVVGSGEEAMRIYIALRDTGRWEKIVLIDAEIELLSKLSHNVNFELIINASDNPLIRDYLRKLNLPSVDILSSMSAQLLFCTGNEFKTNGDETRYRQKILESLDEIRRSVYLTKNKEELLKLILSVGLQILRADTGSIMLMNERKRCLYIDMSYGLEPKVMNAAPQKIGKGISGKVARSGRPMLITGKVVLENSDTEQERTDIFSAVCCPILNGTETVGVININSKTASRIFTNDDLHHLQHLATFTADIIKTSHDYERNVNESFVHSVLSDVRAILRLELPMQERLNLTMMKIVNSLHGKLCNLYLLDCEKQQFLIQSSSSFEINLYQNEQIRLNDFFTGRALQSKGAFAFSINMGNSALKKWFLTQPLKIDQSFNGLLMLHIISDHQKFDREQGILEKISDLLQESLSNKIKFEDSRLQSIQYSALSEITFDLAGIHNIRQLVHVIVNNACMVLETESCILNLYNETMNCFEIFDSFSIKGANHIALLKKIDNVISLKTTVDNNALIIPDLLGEGYISEEIPTRSVMTMCLRQNNKIMGALSVYDKNGFGINKRNIFSEHDREVFIKYCLQVTKALNRFIIIKKK